MADLTVTAAQVAVVYPEKAVIVQKTLAAAVTAGQSLFQDANGEADLADANAAGNQQTRYLALEGGALGQSISCLKEGHVNGFTLTSQAYDAPIFQSDTAGDLADSAGTMTVPVGIVEGIDQGGTVTKVLYFNPRWRGDYT